MKTTLIIPDPIFRELKKRAIERDATMSSLVAEFIRRGLAEKPGQKSVAPLPAYHMGESRVDISDRETLHRVMDAERNARLYSRKKEN